MEKYRTIPEGYMRIGEIARKAGVTVRTLQYYDKEGLFSPSAESESGYRLYTDKDLVRLLQILIMKRLRFTLSEIKKRIAAMDTTVEVLDVLTEHAANIRKEINHWTESLNAVESLKKEIIQVDSVDFKKFADILTHLQMKNERYWLVKYLDNDVLDALKNNVSNEENAVRMTEKTNDFIAEAAKLHDEGIPPASGQGQDLAKRFWGWLMEVTDGDINMVQKISEQLIKSTSDEKHDEIMEKFRLFMTASLGTYLDTSSFFTEAAKLHDEGVSAESAKGQDFAERFWGWLMKLTGGDVNMLQQMNEQFKKSASKYDETFKKSHMFMASSLETYFNRQAKENEDNAQTIFK